MTTTRTAWSTRLRRYESKYIDFYEDVILELDSMTWDEVQALRDEISRVGSGNCSWFLYDVARRHFLAAMPASEDGFEGTHRAAEEIRSKRAQRPGI